jgi:hypothetical protein
VLATGACAVVAGIAWWGLTYWQVWANDYLSLPQASQCLVADSSICRLAAALCTGQHRAIVATYSPWLLWLGLSALFFGAGPLTLLKAPRSVERRT